MQEESKLNLLVRILGNDLDGLHGEDQTITNLEFTLKNEYKFEDTEKVFILNRIVCVKKKKEIIELLNRYDTEFIDLPFDMDKFNKLPKITASLSQYKKFGRKKIVNTLKEHNLYLVNNNNSRNYCIEYGKKKGYEWIFVLDSNSFFTKEDFEDIINNIGADSEYLIIPQKRLKDNNISNDILLTDSYKDDIDGLPNQEPQMAFKGTSERTFNSKIPYGLAPKAELLTALGVKGKWNKWLKFYDSSIKPRKFTKIKYKTLSRVIRLNPNNKNNKIENNWELRWIGIYLLVQEISKRKKEDVKSSTD